jgi:hypothetical protein
VFLAFSIFASTQAWIVGVVCLAAGAVAYGVKKYAVRRNNRDPDA